MTFVGFLVLLFVVYVAVGFVVHYVNTTVSKDDEFTVDWNKIMLWPKEVFHK